MMIFRFIGLLLLLVWVQTVRASNGVSEDAPQISQQQDGGKEKERAEIPDAPVVSYNGVRYEAVHWGKARGLKQNGGYIEALNEKTGKRKWLVRVYAVRYNRDIESDKQDVFIRKLELSGNKRLLLIENDKGQKYTLDLVKRTVKGPLSEPGK